MNLEFESTFFRAIKHLQQLTKGKRQVQYLRFRFAMDMLVKAQRYSDLDEKTVVSLLENLALSPELECLLLLVVEAYVTENTAPLFAILENTKGTAVWSKGTKCLAQSAVDAVNLFVHDRLRGEWVVNFDGSDYLLLERNINDEYLSMIAVDMEGQLNLSWDESMKVWEELLS